MIQFIRKVARQEISKLPPGNPGLIGSVSYYTAEKTALIYLLKKASEITDHKQRFLNHLYDSQYQDISSIPQAGTLETSTSWENLRDKNLKKLKHKRYDFLYPWLELMQNSVDNFESLNH